eukprot:SAG31_NODE_21338_length_552_cov_0.783664_1_plen_101_part_10
MALWAVAADSAAPRPLGLGRGTNWLNHFQMAGERDGDTVSEVEPDVAVAKTQCAAVILGRHTGDVAIDEWKRYRGGRCGQIWIDRTGGVDFKMLLPLPGRG